MATAQPAPEAVAFPERSLTYAPLLVAAGRWIPLLCDGGAQVAEAVAGGAALAGALPLPDLVDAVAAGAPLVAFGALTRRWGGQLVVAHGADLPRSAEGLRDGSWRAVRVGLRTGSDGSERLVRLWLLSAESGHQTQTAPPALGAHGALGDRQSVVQSAPGDGSPAAYLERDPWAGEPRWLGFGTGEGLVAALKDGRIAAFVGPSSAAAQAVILGAGDVVANFSDGSTAPDAGAALPVVLAARTERVGESLLAELRVVCARGAAALSGDGGPALVSRAFSERDPLVTRLALRLDVPRPSPADGLYAADGRLAAGAVERYLELATAAGATLSVAAASLVAPGAAAP